MLIPVTIDGTVVALFDEAAKVLAPPNEITALQWAERERILSTESSALTGQYRVEVAPYQAGMHDAVNVPGVEEIVYFTAAQMGKSLTMEDIFGYFVDEDPCPVIWMWPSDKVAKEWSIDTLEPFIRDTPALAAKFLTGSRKSANTSLFKKFPGGWLAVIGATAPAGLRRRRARVVICDEVDGYDMEAGDEGDPISLVTARSETFWNKLLIVASTCTNKGESRIEARYEISNKMRYWVPCPRCGLMQILRFAQIKFPRDEEPTADNTYYQCEGCEAKIYEIEKRRMLAAGEWIAQAPEVKHILGFWINKLYSPFVEWAELARRFKKANKAKAEGDPGLLKAFINLDLAETWEEKDEAIDREGLVKRCEHYTVAKIPDGVVVITAGVDVQEDRIECELVGWGIGFQSWSLDRKIFEGDTSKLQSEDPAFPSPWERLDKYLEQEFMHTRGVTLHVASAFVDSGYNATEVYAWTKSRNDRRIFASKGMSNFQHPPLGQRNRNNSAKVRMYPVGVSQLKMTIYRWLKIETPGPAYCHFTHAHNDAVYFDQLTAEKLKKKYEKGFPVKYWALPAGARNEALDMRVYAYAALLSLSVNPHKMLEMLRDQLAERARKAAEERARKVDPNQLSLLEQDPIAAVDQAEPATAALPGERELYDLAAKPATPPAVVKPAECTPQPRPPDPPKIRFRRSNWLNR